MVAVLHNIRSSHNVGSMFRTMDAAGVEHAYLSGITPGPVDTWGRENKQLTKVSLGAENHVSYEHVPFATRLLDKLKKDGYTIFAIEQDKRSISLYRASMPKFERVKTAFVVGNEIRGLSPAILKRADIIIEIPMRGTKESLNVAVAFGIVVYQLTGSK